MKGNLYRRNQDGCIYEVIGQDDSPDAPERWILWNDRIGERQFVDDFLLMRQVGWELVGKTGKSGPQETTARKAPPALMK
jgi:hypothetical protein